MKKSVVFLLLLMILACKREVNVIELLESGKWIDLTWCFEENTTYWPTNQAFDHDTVFYGINDKGFFYSSFRYSAEEHGGTHFDAPVHFAEKGRSVEAIPVEELTGVAVMIDVSKSTQKERDYLVSKIDFSEWEELHGKIPQNCIVLINTGYGQYWGDQLMYTGTLKQGSAGVEELHFPGLGPEAAEWLISERKIKAVGIDTPSIDYGQSKDFMTHRVLCARGITVYENVANLDFLPAKGFYLVAAPMKIKGGSGAPLRLFAFIPD